MVFVRSCQLYLKTSFSFSFSPMFNQHFVFFMVSSQSCLCPALLYKTLKCFCMGNGHMSQHRAERWRGDSTDASETSLAHLLSIHTTNCQYLLQLYHAAIFLFFFSPHTQPGRVLAEHAGFFFFPINLFPRILIFTCFLFFDVGYWPGKFEIKTRQPCGFLRVVVA